MRLAHDELAFLWVFPLAFGVVFVRWHASFRPFEHTRRATAYLDAMWAVQGVTLTLSLTVVIFVFQAVYASRLGGSLRRFAEETGLFLMFYVGLAGLFLDGIVLLGGGHNASGGWAATWAVCWAALQGLSLIYLFVSTIHAIEPGALHRRRLRHAGHEIQRATERIILRRLALNFLRDYAEQQAFEFVPFLASAPSNSARAVRAYRTGEVRDLRLRVLRRLAQRSARRGLTRPRLAAQLGARVRDSSDLLWVEPEALTRRPRRAFRIRRLDREQGFLVTVEELHKEALQAIQTLSPTGYSEVTEIYQRMLLALPETWAQYGQSFGPSVAGEATPFELGFLDYLERNLYLEAELAVTGASREIMHVALDFPLQIAIRALDLQASALCGRMLRLWVAGVAIVIGSVGSTSRTSLLDWLRLRISEYGRLYVTRLITDGDSRETREFGATSLLQTIDTVAAVAKELLDSDPTERRLIVEFSRVPDDYLLHWHPEHDAPQRWDVEVAENAGVDEEALIDLRRRFAENQEKVAIRERIDDWKAIQRFGLLFWILRHVRDGGEPEWVDAWELFANYFGEVTRLARVTEMAIQVDYEDRGRWSHWVLETLPQNRVHGLAVDLEFIQTFVVRSLSLVSPDGPPPTIEPMMWMRGRLENPAEIVHSIATREHFQPLLPRDRLDERARVLVEALEGANERRKRLESRNIAEAPVDEARVEAFKRVFRESFWSDRWLRASLAAAGVLELVPGNPPNENSGSYVDEWMSKGMFIAEATIAGTDMTAQHLAHNLANHENAFLVDALREAAALDQVAGERLAATVRRAIAELDEHGHAANLILMPFAWRLYDVLDFEVAEARGGDAPARRWIPEEARAVFVGLIEGTPVCQMHRLDDEWLFVVDLTHFVHWREWTRGSDGVLCELDILTRQEAVRVAEEERLRVEGDANVEIEMRIDELMTMVHFRSGVRRDQDILDLDAARMIRVPEEFRQH